VLSICVAGNERHTPTFAGKTSLKWKAPILERRHEEALGSHFLSHGTVKWIVAYGETSEKDGGAHDFAPSMPPLWHIQASTSMYRLPTTDALLSSSARITYQKTQKREEIEGSSMKRFRFALFKAVQFAFSAVGFSTPRSILVQLFIPLWGSI